MRAVNGLRIKIAAATGIRILGTHIRLDSDGTHRTHGIRLLPQARDYGATGFMGNGELQTANGEPLRLSEQAVTVLHARFH